MTTTQTDSLRRNDVTKRIAAALKARSGKTWSVTGGRGTGYGWLEVNVPPARRTADWDGIAPKTDARFEGYATMAERLELAALLGLERPIHHQGEKIPAGHDYYREYIDRAEGRTPTVTGTPYWD